MTEPSQPLSKRLETPAFWATAVGLTAAVAAVVTGSLPLALGAMLLGLASCAGPAVIGLREDNACDAAAPGVEIDGELLTDGVGMEEVGEAVNPMRFRERVLHPSAAGRTIH